MTGEKGWELSPTPARTWCGRCKAGVTIEGREQVSSTGVIRVTGRCPACDLRLRAIIGKVDQ